MTDDAFGGHLQSYALPRLSAYLEYVEVTIGGRPALDVYLDGSARLFGLCTPLAHGLNPSRDLYVTATESLEGTIQVLQGSSGLAEPLSRNLVEYRALVAFRSTWLREAGEDPEKVFISAEPAGDRDASPNWLLSALQQSSLVARRSMSAIAYEHSLVWTVLRDIGRVGPDFDVASLADAFQNRGSD